MTITLPLRRCLVWAALLLCVGASGCSTSDCLDLGCDRDQVCNEETGACELPTAGCEETGCPAPLTCDPTSRECVERSSDCRSSLNATCEGDPSCSICPDGLVCDASDGFCVSNDACIFTSCPIARVCNPSTAECEPIPCDPTDDACPNGTACDEEALSCVTGCRDDRNCRDDQRCARPEGELGVCVTVCQADEGCPWGERCVQTAGQGQCEPEGPCEEDSDCRSGESCRGEVCQRRLCGADDDCVSGEYCDVDTGQCLEDVCEPDPFEPNNSPEEARRLLLGPYLNLSLCRDDREDWYTFRADGGLQLTFALLYDAAKVDLDMEIYQAGRLLASSATFNVQERITLPASTRGNLSIRVYASRGSDALYLISLEATEPTCDEDATEPNDSVADAATVSVDDRTTTLTTCGGDRDTLRLIPPSRGGRVALELTPEGGADPGAEAWSTAFSPDGATWIPILPDDDGRRALELEWVDPDQRPLLLSQATSPITWTLHMESDDSECPDPQPGNNALERATTLGLSTNAPAASDGALCLAADATAPTFETDWYRLELPDDAATYTLSVTLREATSGLTATRQPLTRVALWTGDEALPWRTSTATTDSPPGTAASTLVATLSKVDRPVWLSVGTTSVPGLLQRWPDYALEVGVAPYTRACVQDRSEGLGNDTPETATPLTPEAGPLRAILCPGDRDLLHLPLLDPYAAATLFMRAEEADVIYRIHVNTPDAEPLLEGVLVPIPDSDEDSDGDEDGGGGIGPGDAIFTFDLLPAGAETLWIDLSSGDGTSNAGAVYAVGIE